MREIHRGPVNFPHKWPVTRKMFPFDDVIMTKSASQPCCDNEDFTIRNTPKKVYITAMLHWGKSLYNWAIQRTTTSQQCYTWEDQLTIWSTQRKTPATLSKGISHLKSTKMEVHHTHEDQIVKTTSQSRALQQMNTSHLHNCGDPHFTSRGHTPRKPRDQFSAKISS